jgi:hypothetical protein
MVADLGSERRWIAVNYVFGDEFTVVKCGCF